MTSSVHSGGSASGASPSVALVGCGAVAERFYTPTLAALERDGRTRVTAVIDPNLERAESIAQRFGSASVRGDLSELGTGLPDLVVVASPPRFHSEHTIEALGAGAAVLVEKPIALDIGSAQKMVDTAHERGRPLAVGLFRRFFSSSQAIKEAIDAGLLGRIASVRAHIGDRFSWPVQSDALFKREHTGGGVLIDIGVHVLDLLLWWFGDVTDVTYRDDAVGGVEANCCIDAEFGSGVVGDIRLSRDWKLANRIVIEGERGWMSCSFGRGDELEVGFHDMSIGFDARLPVQRVVNGYPMLDGGARDQAASFAAQVDNVLRATAGEDDVLVSGDEGMRSLRLIERCYAERKPLRYPWTDRDVAEAALAAKPSRSTGVTVRDGAVPRIAVLGASGFVGTRATEMLYHDTGYEVRPVVRAFSSLARLARFDLDYRIADVFDEAALTEAFRGCDVVVSAVAGGLKIHEQAVAPTYAAAQAAGVRRLVYLSTASVHGQAPAPGTTEATPLDAHQVMPYNNAKVRAEANLLRARRGGTTEVVVLRPGIVFGPRSRWVETLASELLDGTAYLIDDGAGICNSIYVDNLVEAIRCAATADGVDGIDGEAFLVSDAETVTWADFYRPVADAFGIALDDIARPRVPTFPRDRLAELERNLRESKTWKRVKGYVPTSAKSTGRAVLAGFRARNRANPYVIAGPPQPKVTREMALLQSCMYRLPGDKARKRLGYEPIVSFEQGMRDSVAWLDIAGYPLAGS